MTDKKKEDQSLKDKIMSKWSNLGSNPNRKKVAEIMRKKKLKKK